MGSQRVGHDLATEEQEEIFFALENVRTTEWKDEKQTPEME